MKKRILFVYIAIIHILLFFLNCSASTVTEKNEPWDGPPRLLIMYYLDGDNDLERDLMLDLNEIEAIDIAYNGIKVVVLVDRGRYWTGDGNWEDTRAYEVGLDENGYNETLSANTKRIAIPALGITKTSTVELNMGDPNTLTKFIQFCKQTYSADNYMLLLANHGSGWRDNTAKKPDIKRSICIDETLSGGAYGSDELTTKELGESIEAGLDISGGGAKLDMLAMDACLMGMIEVAYELRNAAKYFIASSEDVPIYGFPYYQIMNSLNKFKGDMTPEAIAKIFVDDYYDAYTNGLNMEGPNEVAYNITMTVTDLERIPYVVTALNELSALLYMNGYSSLTTMRSSELFINSQSVDLYDLCTKINVSDPENRYASKTADLMNALKDSADAAIYYHKAGKEHSNSTGLAVYLPEQGYFNNDYNDTNLEFAAAAPFWVTIVKNLTEY